MEMSRTPYATERLADVLGRSRVRQQGRLRWCDPDQRQADRRDITLPLATPPACGWSKRFHDDPGSAPESTQPGQSRASWTGAIPSRGDQPALAIATTSLSRS